MEKSGKFGMNQKPERFPWYALAASLTLLAFFSRAWLVNSWGSPVPFWDQWDSEALGLYLPWLEHTLGWRDFFSAHNEHRIVLTRLAALTLFVAQDGWHTWSQLLLNGTLHATTFFLLFHALARDLTPRTLLIFSCGLALLATATAGWQNALWGFQTQFYFAQLFAAGAFLAMAGSAPLTAGWWLGALSASLALLSNGGGWFAPLSVLGGMLIVHFRQFPVQRRVRFIISLGVLVFLTAAGMLLSAKAPQHALFYARDLSQFWAVCSRSLAWPYVYTGGVAFLVMQSPVLFLVVSRWREKSPFTTAERAAVMVALYAGLSAAAVAYSRGGVLLNSVPLSRYHDAFILGTAAQLFALLVIARSNGRPGRLAAIGWCALLMAGLISLTTENLVRHLPLIHAQDQASLIKVRAYAVTGDVRVLTPTPGKSGPHPSSPQTVADIMSNPTIKPHLPVELTQPQDTPLNPPWLIRHARSLTLISALLFAGSLTVLALRSRRPA